MNQQSLTIIDGQTLLSTQLETPRFVVSSLILMGLHILGGAPKTDNPDRLPRRGCDGQRGAGRRKYGRGKHCIERA